MTLEYTTTRRAEAAAKAAADLPEEPETRALALLVGSLLTPQGHGDPILVAEWILGGRPPIDKHLDALRGDFLAEVAAEEDTATDADRAVGWYAAAMGWKTYAEESEAALERVQAVIDEMRPMTKWPDRLRDAIRGKS